MFCTSLSFILRTFDPILCQTSATSKFSVKYTFKRSPVLNSLGNIFIGTTKTSLRMDPAWNLAESQFNEEEMLSSPMLACRVTPKIGTKHGSIAKILLRLMKIHYRVIVSNGSTQSIIFPKSSPLLNVQSLHPLLQRSRLCWETV